MTTWPSFPATVGLGPNLAWSQPIRPKFQTEEIVKVNGRSVRRQAYALAMYEADLSYDILRSGNVYGELEAILGFFVNMRGQFNPFWIALPELASVTGQVLGIGDGTTTTFPIVRTYGTYSEPVHQVSTVSALYLNGSPVAASAALVNPAYPPAVAFATAPGAGVTVSADFQQLWLVRFAEDVLDFSEFMTIFWELKTLKLQTVRPSLGDGSGGPSPWPAPPPLDGMSGVAGGYSFRKLSSTYSGAAVRVARGSDGAQQDIGFDSYGNLDTTALTAFGVGTNCTVAKWYDQSGNGVDLSAFVTAADTAAMIISGAVATTIGAAGRTAALMDATYSNYLASGAASPVGTTAGTAAGVASAAAGGLLHPPPGWDGAVSFCGAYTSDTHGVAFYLGFDQSGAGVSAPVFIAGRYASGADDYAALPYALGTDAVLMLRWNTGDPIPTKAYLGGGTPATNLDTTANEAPTALVVGQGGNPFTSAFIGTFAELIVKASEMSLTDANWYGANAGAYYGVPWAAIGV